MTITRYQCRYEDAWHSKYGDYVLHTDHLAALADAERRAYERGVREAAKACDWGDIYGDNAVRCILALLTQEGR